MSTLHVKAPMSAASRGEDRRQRLEEMLTFAQAFRGWTMKQLGRALDRDPSNLVPDSGMPKLDLVVRLSRVLAWPLEQVVAELGGIGVPLADQAACRQAGAIGRRDGAPDGPILEDAWLRPTPRDAGSTLTRMLELIECGRFAQAMETARVVTDDPTVEERRRLPVMERLAECCAATGHLFEAMAIASEVAHRAARHDADAEMLASHARACAIRGECRAELALAAQPNPTITDELVAAEQDLLRARGALASQQVTRVYPRAAERARIADATLLEIDTALGRRPARDAIAAVMREIEPVIEVRETDGRARLEALGWWCLAGCRIALAHLGDAPDLHRTLAILTNKADEIATVVRSWRLHERVLSMEFERRERVAGWLGVAEAWVLDREDLRLIVGCVGGNPRFRDTGLRILRAATIVDE